MGFITFRTMNLESFIEKISNYKEPRLLINNIPYVVSCLKLDEDKDLMFVNQKNESECIPIKFVKSIFFEDDNKNILFLFEQRKKDYSHKQRELSNSLIQKLGVLLE